MPDYSDPAAPRTGLNPATEPGQQIYNLINSIVAPRPIAWVSTLSESGIANVAPHSYCMIVSSHPPIIAFSSSGTKDTLRNVRHTREFVFNHVPESLMQQMNLTSADFPPNESEFAWAGLTPVPGEMVRTPRVGESPAALECRLLDIQEWGDGPSHLIIGEVVHIAVDPAFMANGLLDLTRTRPVGRLARIGYSRTAEFYDVPRPTYKGLVESGETPQQ